MPMLPGEPADGLNREIRGYGQTTMMAEDVLDCLDNVHVAVMR